MASNFWRDLPRPFIVLAPMEDVTNVVFRHVISEAARLDVFFTEFTDTDSFCHLEGIYGVRGRLTFTKDEQPIVVHIWGDKPEHFRDMSVGMAELGFKGVDININTDRKSTRLNSSHVAISYAVFCLKKKKN